MILCASWGIIGSTGSIIDGERMAITSQEFSKIATIVDDSVRHAVEPLEVRLGAVEKQLDVLTSNVDQFLRIVQRHEQEWLIIRAQHQKMRELLVKKGIATEEELAIA